MKTNIKHIAFAIPVLFAITITLCSFAPLKNYSHANGGGTADGINFSFSVMEKNNVTSGYIHYGTDSYSVCNSSWYGKSVIIYTTDGHAFFINEIGKPSSSISDPIAAEWGFLSPSDFFGIHCISSGNIHVKE